MTASYYRVGILLTCGKQFMTASYYKEEMLASIK
jgi:hypothetical protein